MNKKKVLVGMSGGVDSSVAAAVLIEQGYIVEGATMRLWQSDEDRKQGCSDASVEDARRVCEKLGIKFHVFDFRDLFSKKVVDYFVDEYINGRTPNPCIACNKNLKFDAMLQKAIEMGFDYVATGHYAKIEKDENDKYILRMADFGGKDQSYVLYQFTQEQLSHTLMPLGEYTKEWVRQKAEDLGLDVANKPESMEICFVSDNDYAGFIKRYRNYEPKPGMMLDWEGNIIGEHKGLIYYTIGQRKGIGAFGRPMFVMKMDAENNTITLGEKGMEFYSSLYAEKVNFISGEELKGKKTLQVKIRYQAKPAPAVIEEYKNGVKVTFNSPQRAVTPGQSVVFYDGDIVLGGGTVISME